MRNDSLLKALRPLIETENITVTELERFQNEVLRPILKFQHSLLEIEIDNNLLIHKLLKQALPEERKRLLIKGIISKPELKNQLLGQITGLLTNSEFQFYYSKKKEIDKRIFAMLLDRIMSIEI
jgi:predicted rRNA methylase YqxC with S4 and FtsJ domains